MNESGVIGYTKEVCFPTDKLCLKVVKKRLKISFWWSECEDGRVEVFFRGSSFRNGDGGKNFFFLSQVVQFLEKKFFDF